MMEADLRIQKRIAEFQEQRTERILEAGYAVAVKLPHDQRDELRAVLQALWTRTFYKEKHESS